MSEPRTPEPSDRKALLKRALVRMEELESELRTERERSSEPIALIGMGCRFPGGARDIDAFRKLLREGFDATCEIPADRWDVDSYYDADPETPGTMYVRRGAFLTEPVDEFDAAFFGIAPREADELDPQQRLLLEVVWEALERAGQSPAALRGSATGMFLGMAAHDWSRLQGGAGDTSVIGTYYGTGSAHSVAAGRVSYILGLRGPAVTIDTACSSSLVAFHSACQSLRTGETRMAIAAGVSLILAPDGHVIASRGRMLSPKGRCHTFDAAADGYVRGEGCAVVLLKRLSDAIADGDSILAVVRGTATNQDGRSGGLTVPSGTAQEDVMRTALANSGLQPADVDYVEAHGTGTELGDPIEVHALAAVHADRPADRPLLLGSVKTNVGHLEAAAGLAGVLKSVIALQDGVIPPHLHFRTPNPHISWDAAPIVVSTEPIPWPRADRRVAGISSFGFSGTNAHVIIESYTQTAPAPADSAAQCRVVPLSARTPGALAALATQVADSIDDSSVTVSAAARTLSRGRAHWEERLAVIATDKAELTRRLRDAAGFDSAETGAGIFRGTANLKRTPRVAFLFTGQGSQRPGMGRELLVAEPIFRDAIERCDALLASRLERSIADLMRADDDDETAAALLQRTHITQPALFALEYGLAQLWRSWGVEPSVVVGHSIGEYVAACVAGVLSLEDALTLVAERGRLMGALEEGGAMAAVFTNAATVRPLLSRWAGRLSIAAENAPENTVVSGDEDAVDELLAHLRGEGTDSRRLVVSHAFHSHRMEPMLEEFRAIATGITYRAPRIDVIADVTGERALAGTFDADYWVRQIRSPVLFTRMIEAVRAEGVGVLLEAGPAPVLLSLAAACPGASEGEVRQPTLRPGHDAARCIQEALAGLYVAGVPLDWNSIHHGRLDPVPLPTYPFQRERHWFATRPRRPEDVDTHPLLGRRIESPRLNGSMFESVLHEDAPAWLAGHRVFSRAVVPAAAFLEMCHVAVDEVCGSLERPAAIRIHEPLFVDVEQKVQTIVDRGARTVEIVSHDDARGWRTHVTGRIEAAAPLALDPIALLDDGEDVDADALRARIRENGVEYGSPFEGLVGIRRTGTVAAAEIDAGRLPSRERRRYAFHPAMLDAAFQLCGTCIEGSDGVYLPVEVEAVEYAAGAADTDSSSATSPVADRPIVVHAALRDGEAGAAVLVCDVEVTAPDVTLRVRGLRFQRATTTRRSADRRAAEWLYAPAWANVDIGAATRQSGQWIVVADGDDGALIADVLERHGRTARIVNTTEVANGATDVIAGTPRLDGLVVVVPSSAPPASADTLTATLRPVLMPLLDVARRIAAGAECERFCLVTRGAWAIDSDDIIDPAATAAWGLAHTIAAELPNVACRRVDVRRDVPLSTIADTVADALLCSTDEDRLALRQGGWQGARLAPVPAPARAFSQRPLPDYRLKVGASGDLSTLVLATHDVREPAADQVTIRVDATGLNFRDVLNALDMYPGDAGPLGSECAGTVEATGSDVIDLHPGDRVMAITPLGFCSRVNASAALTVRIPAGMTSGDAATLPIAFLTADWALDELAQLRAGERVLIHAAAGGVGMAAVQIAQAAGAEVFATAGSRRKRALLRRLGVRHIYDSRSLAFRDEIMRDTQNEGVHVVLNSLADEFIPASLETLRTDGRFVEIGKTGVWDTQRVAHLRPHAHYHVLYLGEACETQPERVRARFLALAARFESGDLKALPVRGFLVDDAPAAFRYMAQARHVGKVVLFDSDAAMDAADDRSAVWITGGLGGIGLALAGELVGQGTRRIVLTSRTPSAAAEAALAPLRAAGAEIIIETGDVSSLEDVVRVRDSITGRGWRIESVLHAAGVLDDAMLSAQNWDRFETVFAPKATGAWNLHVATMHLPVRSFVLFSAGAGLLGSPGQANYAAANAFIDGLAQLRRSIGLPASSIAWGPWADAGMAARAGMDWSARGMQMIDVEAGAAALARIIRDDIASAAVLPIDWTRFPAHTESGARRPLFALVQKTEQAPSGAAPPDWRSVLAATPAAERNAHLQTLVAGQVTAVLGLDAARPPAPRQGLTDLGMDSLMAVELSNRLGRALGEKLPSTFIFEYPTVEAMGTHLLERLGYAAAVDDTVESDDATTRALAAMSDEDATSALLDELEQIGY